MSALHRLALKRPRGETTPTFDLSEATHDSLSATWSGSSTTSAEASSSSAYPPPTLPGSANNGASSHLPNGTRNVAPEGGEEQAELGGGISHRYSATAGLRGAVHAAQVPATSAAEAVPEKASQFSADSSRITCTTHNFLVLSSCYL